MTLSSPPAPLRPPTPPRPSMVKRYSSTSAVSDSSSASASGGLRTDDSVEDLEDTLFPGGTGTTTRGTTPRTAQSSANVKMLVGCGDRTSGTGSDGSEASSSALAAERRYRRKSSAARPGSDSFGGGTDMTPSSSHTTFAITADSTPTITGAGRMAIAARERLKGKGKASSLSGSWYGDGEVDEDHPSSDKVLESRGYHSFICFQHPFHLESRWKLLRELGQGAYGLVISAQDSLSGETIAIKMITRIFDKIILARRCLREITLLRHLNGHENITGLIDLDTVTDDFNEVYMFMEPMEADLHQIIRSGQQLTNAHIQYFLYQLLRGMKYIHSANVIHRDLKPGNILVNADCELKICDLGLARGFRPDPAEWDPNSMGPGGPLTEYVATRWYRAPEIMLSYKRYSTAIDVWSIGCILAELLGGKPLFKGKDYIDQLNLILQTLGTPSDETVNRVASEKACAYIRSLPVNEKVPFSQIFPDADPDAIDLLEKFLAFDPAERITVAQALSHPYLASYHDETDEPDCPAIFDKWEIVEGIQTMPEFREAIKREVDEFRHEVRTVDEWDHLSAGEQVDPANQDGGYFSPKSSEVGLPSPSPTRPSPARAFTALPATSDDPAANRPRSRRTSSMSPHSRRPSSALFGNTPIMGMTPLPGPGQIDGMAQSLPRGHVSRSSFSGSEFAYRGSKSRQTSSSMGDRPLLRALSSLSVRDLGGTKSHPAHDPPPMSVSPSDAPPSEQPLEFRPRSSRKTSQETAQAAEITTNDPEQNPVFLSSSASES